MKTSPATFRPSRRGSGARASRVIESSRAAREKAVLALTPAERLTLALELSDLCAELASAGRRAEGAVVTRAAVLRRVVADLNAPVDDGVEEHPE